MANLQVKIDDQLRIDAHNVASSLGLDLATAVRMFLKQMVRENGLPFRPTNDPFYSAENHEALRRSAAQMNEGQVVVKTLDELRSLE
ncbi:MAG: type II toxin-antitoxin system RelB/DinJ family antitoxin [Desulfovibrionaceae bacterium]|nr:type II toxin-antitoxin system RelB/DinJ family antitoxin [Desulfovibrionaceae bacterium]